MWSMLESGGMYRCFLLSGIFAGKTALRMNRIGRENA